MMKRVTFKFDYKAWIHYREQGLESSQSSVTDSVIRDGACTSTSRRELEKFGTSSLTLCHSSTCKHNTKKKLSFVRY